MVSIIIPTYNEQENVTTISQAIRGVFPKDVPYEIIFVDDSTDETPEILKGLAESDSNVRFFHREDEKGLGTAVMKGFELAKGSIVTVMDADLQHPPSMLIAMIHEIKAGADIVIPSRFIPGGSDGGLRLHRKVISAGARYLGKVALKKLRRINDPTSGFFAVKKSVIRSASMNPIGWKILIEILVRGSYERVTEIPYRFQPRYCGKSKMSLKEQLNYVRHLFKLVLESKDDRRFFTFIGVGLSGVLINMLCYGTFIHAGTEVSYAAFISALIALTSNFFLNDRITWSDVRGQKHPVRALKYFVTSIIGIGINIGVLRMLYYDVHFTKLLSDLLGIGVATTWNYGASKLWTWKSTATESLSIEVSKSSSLSSNRKNEVVDL